MKRLIVSSICLMLFGLLAPCMTPFAGSKDLKIAIILWRGKTPAEKGFQDKLKELGYSVTYTIYNANQNRPELAGILRTKLLKNLANLDYVYSFGTTATLMTKKIVQDKVPHIFVAVAKPVASGIVLSMESTGHNISGFSPTIPLIQQIKTALQVTPFKKLGVPFNPREDNSAKLLEELKEIAQKLNFEIITIRTPPNTDWLEKSLDEIVNGTIEVDAVYVLMDSYLISQSDLIAKKLRKAKDIITIGGMEKHVKKGILIGVVADYYKMGQVAASILDKHSHGTSLKDIPVHTEKNPLLLINEKTMELLNVKIPIELQKNAIFVQ